MKAVDPQSEEPQVPSRAQEKAASRLADETARASGDQAREDLRRENGAFAFPRERVALTFTGRKF